MARWRKLKKPLLSFLSVTAGSIVMAAALSLFLEPFSIAPGGLSGIGIIITHLWGFPTGLSILLMNIPLLIAGFVKFGRKFIAYTAYATVLSSLAIDFFAAYPAATENELLATLYGGIFLGLGLGLVFAGGATTGGTDILVKLLRLKFRHLKLGRLILVVDAVVVVLSVFAFQNLDRGLYAAVALYISTLVFDSVVYRFDFANVAYLISDKPDELVSAISQRLDRGATYLNGRGGYTGETKQVILCALKRNELPSLYRLVEELDPDAFLIVLPAHQVYGDGFTRYGG